MRRILTTILLSVTALTWALAQDAVELTTSEARQLYKTTSKSYISVHDPSVVWHPTEKRFYIVGSHHAMAYTSDMQNWSEAQFSWATVDGAAATNAQAFVTPQVTKIKKNGVETDFPAFNAWDWGHSVPTVTNNDGSVSTWSIDGNMWAPDLIWNPTMKKWCLYLSINGFLWNSSIILLTADDITGPYVYQGPVVITGFRNRTDANISYKKTDLEFVIGTQSQLPDRYNMGDSWGSRWPHAIDPAVFFDEEGNLWLVYGSWSGGIWMLQLDETTGLRDYDVTYPGTDNNKNTVTSDPYFGTKVAGGLYVSGEGPYIEHIGNYYFLFVSYGGFAPDGGYEMRIFRSAKPNGPYKDSYNRSAIFDTAVKNYGAGTDNRGEKIMGAYNLLGYQTLGETAQGHNSIIAAEDGKTYLIYHTKFNDGHPEWGHHQVRCHQVFLNRDGWLVASPFEYNGDDVTDELIARQELVSRDDIPGTYGLIMHKYKMDYANMEEVTPVSVTLNADGTVSGAYTGTWTMLEGTSYFNIKLGAYTYKGVVIEQTMDTKSTHALCFTAANSLGVNVWGYKLMPKYELACQLNDMTVPVSNGQRIVRNADLYGMVSLLPNTTLNWSSSEPQVFSSYGVYNPAGLEADLPAVLSARMETGNYYWQKDYSVTLGAESFPVADWKTGLVGHYGFDSTPLQNTFNATQTASLMRRGTTAVPTLSTHPMRNGNTVHTAFGANGSESYVEMDNPLFGKDLSAGATLSFWVCRNDDNLWDALFAFTDGTARLYMTGNEYIGFNDGQGNYLDINHPSSYTTGLLPVGTWHLVTLAISRTASKGITVYVDGTEKTGDRYQGVLNEKSVTTKSGFNYNLIVDLLQNSPKFYLGYGSFWGSAKADFDDILFHERVLTKTQITAVNTMENRYYDYSRLTDGILPVVSGGNSLAGDARLFDLQGRQAGEGGTLRPGIYVRGGRKVVVR